ncbi:MAG: exo-alpha-sialidase [Lacunisphaera sp.]|nr:exo-alpha-sialidase [Lacunisphaera sp.]
MLLCPQIETRLALRIAKIYNTSLLRQFACALLYTIGLQAVILQAQSKAPILAHDEVASRVREITLSPAKADEQILQYRIFAAERITIMQQGGFWPSVAMLQNGELIVIARTGAPHGITRGGSRLELVRSADLGKTWSDPVWVAASRPEEDLRDGFVTELKDGTLMLSFHIYRFETPTQYDPVNVNVYVTRSQDRGRTWSVPEKVNTSPFPFGSPHGRIIELPEGVLLLQATVGFTQRPGWANLFRPEAEREFQSIVLRSRDGGKTWGDQSVISKGDETSLLLLPSGKLLAAVRGGPVSGSARSVSIHGSADAGHTWKTLGSVTDPGEVPGNLLLLRDGRILLCYGDRKAPFFGVQAVTSRDDGRTWDRGNRFQLVWDAPNTDCGYPNSVQLPDGRVFTAYYQVDDLADSPASAKARAVIWTVTK